MTLEQELIKSLEDYIYILGVSGVRIKSLAAIQHVALTSNFLQDDEREQVLSIKHSLVQAFAGIRILLEMVGEHTTINIEETVKRLQTRMHENGNNQSNLIDSDSDNVVVGGIQNVPAIQNTGPIRKPRGRPKKSLDTNRNIEASIS